MNEDINDFSKGKVWKNILRLAVPITLAQLVQILYSIVDKMYIGHLPNDAGNAITGLGITFPIIMIINAFTQFAISGGSPLCSIERGRGDNNKARSIMCISFTMLLFFGAVLMLFFYVFLKPVLYAFGASDITYPYARDYMLIYLSGTLFVMTTAGMNPFINLQGFGKTGMMTTLIGAGINILLDPLLIFVFGWGIRGAAISTVLSQFISAAWVLKFLTGKKAILKINLKDMVIKDFSIVLNIIALGMSGFIMAVTNSITQVVYNYTLFKYGGDVYVGIMTIINSIRETVMMIIHGIGNGAQPVIGFNYGAGKYKRVKQGIFFICVSCGIYTVLVWAIVNAFPMQILKIFTSDRQIVETGVDALKIYFGGFYMMGLQFCGQTTFVALGRSKNAIFFSLFRKVIIVVPFALLLPIKFGVLGVFYSEPISNFIGGTACFVTMLCVMKKLLNEDKAPKMNFTN